MDVVGSLKLKSDWEGSLYSY